MSLDYESMNETHPMLLVTVTHERKVSDARATYHVLWNSLLLGLNIGDAKIDVEEDNSFFKIGDQSKFGFIKYQGNLIGNILVFMKGTNVYTFLMTGYYIDDNLIWAELFNDKVALLQNFE